MQVFPQEGKCGGLTLLCEQNRNKSKRKTRRGTRTGRTRRFNAIPSFPLRFFLQGDERRKRTAYGAIVIEESCRNRCVACMVTHRKESSQRRKKPGLKTCSRNNNTYWSALLCLLRDTGVIGSVLPRRWNGAYPSGSSNVWVVSLSVRLRNVCAVFVTDLQLMPVLLEGQIASKKKMEVHIGASRRHKHSCAFTCDVLVCTTRACRGYRTYAGA